MLHLFHSALCSCWFFLYCFLFTLHFSLCFSCSTFLYFIFCCCIHIASLFILHSFSVSGFLFCLFQYCSSLKLHNFHVALCSYCTIFVLHVFHVALFFVLHFFQVVLFTCFYFFLFHFFSILIIFIKVSGENCWYFLWINILTVYFSGTCVIPIIFFF